MAVKKDAVSIKKGPSSDGNLLDKNDPRRAPERYDFDMMPSGKLSFGNLPDQSYIQEVRYNPTLKYMKD